MAVFDGAFRYSQHKKVESLPDLVSHTAKGCDLPVGWSLCGVIESPMDGLGTWKDGALLSGTITNGDDEIELLAAVFRYGFRAMVRDVDSYFFHRFDASRMKSFRMSSSAEYFESIAGDLAKQSFSHLTPGGVSGA